MTPLQAPVAVQLVALLELQVRVALFPFITDVGAEVKIRVGAGGEATDIATLLVAEELIPLQVKIYVLPEIKLPVDSLPDVALVPDQSPVAVQLVALVELQESVVLSS